MTNPTLSEELAKLIEALIDGKTGADRNLTDHLRRLDPELLLPLAAHSSSVVREALASSMEGRDQADLAAVFESLVDDTASEVMDALANVIAARPTGELVASLSDKLVSKLIGHRQSAVRYKGLLAAVGRKPLAVQLAGLLKDDSNWGVRERAAKALGGIDAPVVHRALVRSMLDDDDDDVGGAAALVLEHSLGQEQPAEAIAVELIGLSLRRLAKVKNLLDERGIERFPMLAHLVTARLGSVVDLEDLAEFGTNLTAEARRGSLPRGHYLDRSIEAAIEVLDGDGPKAVMFFGESGVGKTAAIHELAHRMAARDEDSAWHVIRIIPSELLVGTKYVGEWETKVQRLIEACLAPKRVLLVISSIEGLTSVGKSSSSNANVADLLSPHIEAGRLAILCEMTPATWKGPFGQSSSFGRLFRRITMEPTDAVFTRELLELITVENGLEFESGFLERLLELANYHFSNMKLPGRAVGFLRLIMEFADQQELRIGDLLTTLSRTSGIPVDMLDDNKALDLDGTRSFLANRVMGQDQAIDCVLDLVTLVKAGLADPSKPPGVLLFVGPTGVGKTELARALAELLFGNADRLLRFDMSEYATFQSFERLIGKEGEAGLLTGAVAEKPFSVLLLDEIEKSHQNVFDLCLQIFDAGRLTDGSGKTVDFRHTIVILTSNIGSRIEVDAGLGFGGEVAPAPDADSIGRELRLFFRPEFLGRLDQIVTFKPLGAETADRIARREVAKVLERGGIARRGVTIDVDPAVFGLLLREGYSPALGARPLKRAVERILLLPIARVLATGSASRGATLSITAGQAGSGQKVAVQIIAEPDQETDTPDSAPAFELADLAPRLELLHQRAVAIEVKKDELLAQTTADGFWDQQEQAGAMLDGIHRYDRLLSELAHLDAEIDATATNPNTRRRGEFVRQHELAAGRLELLFDAADRDDLDDALVTITRAKAMGKGMDGVSIFVRMYSAFSRRLGLECEVLSESSGDGTEQVVLGIRGPGARALFAMEEGLHQLKRERSRHSEVIERELLRVEVDPAGAPTFPAAETTLTKRRLQGASSKHMNKPTWSLKLLHSPTMTSVEFRTDKDQSPGDLPAYLAGRVARGAESAPAMVRRYSFGASPLVRDRRTGRSTGRLERVLRGELELFF